MKASNVLAACAVISVAGAQVVAAQSPQAPKPGPEHARLGYFVGKWKTEGEMKPSPIASQKSWLNRTSESWFS